MLTLDLGNGRLKLTLWSRDAVPVVQACAAFERCDEAPHRAGRWLAEALVGERARPRVLAWSSVAADDAIESFLAELEPFVDGPSLRAEAGLASDCVPPEDTGSDRLLAARAALELLGRAALVVDVGSALTVDAVRPERPDGRFLGGAIAPGPALLSRALATGGARLFEVEPRSDAPALGRSSEAALRAGVVVGLRGAARELVEEVAREAGLESAPVVLTGGASALLLEPRAFTTRVLHVVPDLVQRGLAWAARRALTDAAVRG